MEHQESIFSEHVIASLPTPFAIALNSYACVESSEHGNKTSLIKLWYACDAVELLVKLLVLVSLAELQPRKNWPAIARQVRDRIERPTLGSWRAILIDLVRLIPPSRETVLDELRVLGGEIKEFFDGGQRGQREDIEASFLALRNRLAHGGGMYDAPATELLAIWEGKIDRFLGRFAWLRDLDFFAQDPAGRRIALRGGETSGIADDAGSDDGIAAAHPDEVTVCRATHRVGVWPLIRYGLPKIPALQALPVDTVVEIYSRRSSFQGFHYTPIGIKSAHWSISDTDATERFEMLFPPVQNHDVWDAADSFREEIRASAKEFVGRRPELNTIRDQLLASPQDTPALFWITGPAGIGKSVFMAKITDLLMSMKQDPSEGRRYIVPYRFRRGDVRCSRAYFCMLASHSLMARENGNRKGNAAPATEYSVDALKQALASLAVDAQCIFILDGIDEIDELDARFADEVCLELVGEFRGKVRWLLAGRDQSSVSQDLDTRLRKAGACVPFPNGLERMDEADIRAILLDQIGPVREALIKLEEVKRQRLLDVEATDAVVAELRAGRVPQVLRDGLAANGCELSREATGYGGRGTSEDAPSPSPARWLIDDPGGKMLCVEREGGALVVWLEETSSAFIDSLAQKSDGLPLYIRYVVRDIQDGRLSRFDGRERLPEGMAGYYQRLLRQHGIGTLQTMVTRVISLIAVARESLTRPQITECISDGLAKKQRADEWFEKTMPCLSSLLREGRGVQNNASSYSLYHHSLRQHLESDDEIRDSVDLARDWLTERMCIDGSLSEAGPFAGYVARHGVVHLLEADMIVEAVALLDRLRTDPDTHRHVLRRYLASVVNRQVARALRDLLDPAHADALDTRRSTMRHDQLSRMAPDALLNIVSDTYETGVYGAVLRIVIEFHYEDWWLVNRNGIRDRFLDPYDMVARHTLGEALSDVYLDNEALRTELINELTVMALGENAEAREAAGYAFEEIFLEMPELLEVHWDVVERWAGSDTYTERMVLGELLIRGAHARRESGVDLDIAGRIQSDAFWNPIWDYNAIDVEDFRILGFDDPADPAVRGDPQFIREHEATRRLRERLLRELRLNRELDASGVLLALLASYDELGPDDPLIQQARPVLASAMEQGPRARGLAVDVIKLLFSHTLWAVTEGATTLVADLVDDDPSRVSLIQALLDEPDSYWRVRYGAIDAAFNVRERDGYALLREALKKNFAHANCRVRGICFDEFFAWVRLAAPSERVGIVDEFELPLRSAIATARDCWELEYIYLLFSFLHWQQPDIDVPEWLGRNDRHSRYLGEAADTPFYLLDRQGFLRRIDRIRRAELAGRGEGRESDGEQSDGEKPVQEAQQND